MQNQSLEGEENRVSFKKLKKLIEDGERMNNRLFNELKDEKHIRLIFLNSQLAAEKARSAYFCNLISIKEFKGSKNFELTQKMLEIGYEEKSMDSINDGPFSTPSRDSDVSSNDSGSVFNALKFMPRYSERINLDSQREISEMQTHLQTAKQKYRKLKSSLDYNSKAMQLLEETSDKYKEITISLEEKVHRQQSELIFLKNELENKEKFIKQFKHMRDTSSEELLEEKSREIEKLKSNLKFQTDRIARYEEENKAQKAQHEKEYEELSKIITQLQQENRNSYSKILQLNEEIETLKTNLLNEKDENKSLHENFEEEKEEIISKYQSMINELKIQVKNLRDRRSLLESIEVSENELSELEDGPLRRESSEPSQLYGLSIDTRTIEGMDNMRIVDSLYLDLRSHNMSMASLKSEAVQVVIEEEDMGKCGSREDWEMKVAQMMEQIESEKAAYEKLDLFNKEIMDLLTCILYNISDQIDSNLQGDLEKLKSLFLSKLSDLKSQALQAESSQAQVQNLKTNLSNTTQSSEEHIKILQLKSKEYEELAKIYQNRLLDLETKILGLVKEQEIKKLKCSVNLETSVDAGFKKIVKKVDKKTSRDNRRSFLFWNKPNPIVSALFKN